MKQGSIKIAASVDGYDVSGWCAFAVTVSKGKIESHVHFYGNASIWKEFGEQLTRFPQTFSDTIVIEPSIDSQYENYLLLEAYCYDQNGHAAVKVITDTKGEVPHKCRVEFSIPAEAASINQFGRLLSSWQVEDSSEILWEAQTS